MWMLVMHRKMKYGEEEFEADQTEVVAGGDGTEGSS